MTGIAGVTPHSRIAPTGRIPLETSGEPDQFGDVAHHIVGVLKLAQPLLCHFGTNGLVVTERHTVVINLAGQWFSNVVEQCCQAQNQVGARLRRHRNSVRQNILVFMDRVLLKRKCGQLRNDLRGNTRVDQRPERVQAIIIEQGFAQAISGNCGFHRLTVWWISTQFAPNFLCG